MPTPQLISALQSLRTALPAQARLLGPGVLASLVVAAAASYLGEHYRAPTMLFALLLGLAMQFLHAEGPCRPGIEASAKWVLRFGVALLGLRITLAQVASLGWQPIVMVVGSVLVTIAVSVVAARLLGFRGLFGLLTGGATAICGVSAAMALSAALPHHPLKERATLLTVVGVSVLSTVAMVLYPTIALHAGLTPHQAGLFIGGTIHDVAQVVGAGYSLSTETGDTATLVKLLRVAMLVPVMLLATAITRKLSQQALSPSHGTTPAAKPPLLPGFVVGFAVLVGVNSLGWVPAIVQSAGQDLSRWCLLVAIAAIGMKTPLKELATVGFKPIALMVGETVFLAGLILVVCRWV